MDVRNRTVVITGASSGIGAATARAFAAEGARVVLAARTAEKLEKVIGSLPPESEALAIPADVGVEEEVKHLMERAIDRFGAIDVLVNNAGYGLFKPIVEMSAEEFDQLIRVNLHGVFLATKYVLPHMYERRSGTVITISSIAGKNGFAGGAGYTASKFGVMGLMESVFHEARSHDVRTITICPGSVNTPFFDEAHMSPPTRDSILQPEDVAATILFAAKLPQHALIREMDVRPTNPKRQ